MAVFEYESPNSWIMYVSFPLFLSLSCIENKELWIEKFIYQWEIYGGNFNKYVAVSSIIYWWKHRVELIETNLHCSWFDGGKWTVKIWSVLSVNMFLILGIFFGWHHVVKDIKLIFVITKQSISRNLHLEGDELFCVSVQMISLWQRKILFNF